MKKYNLFFKSKSVYLSLKKNHFIILSIPFLIVCKIINRLYGAGIPFNENINKFEAPHGFYGIFISKNAELGKNCVIYQQVTIGSNSLVDSKGFGAPKIGDNVYIGAGAKIIGNVKIGNNVKIGANCVVTENVPSDCTVVLNHPRIIKRKKMI